MKITGLPATWLLPPVQADLWQWSKHSLTRVYQPVSHHCARSPILRDSAACVGVCECFTAVPGLGNLGNRVEESIVAVTIRQPVERRKLQFLQMACLNIPIYTCTYTHTLAISNDDLCLAWKAGMHCSGSHKHTQTH